MNKKPENKIARLTEQEYAHQYTPKAKEEEYQYANEDKRVGNTPTQNQQNPYDLDIESTIEPINHNTNRIKVKVNTKSVTEDHRQRAYKIKTQPQIQSGTDLGSENMQNTNDARQDEVDMLRQVSKSFAEQIEKEINTDMTNPVERFSAEDTHVNGEDDCDITFNVGDLVVHVEEELAGEVKFVNDKRVAIIWNDRTRERFALSDAKEFLKVTKAYVGDIEQLVDPINSPSFPKNEVLDKKLNNSLSSFELEEEDNVEASIDIEKVKLQRQVNELQTKVNEIDVEKIKTSATNELIDLMQKKGLLSNTEEEVQDQFNAIMAMDDTSYETFKKAIVTAKKSTTEEDDIYALLGEDEDYSDIEDGSEYAKQREEAKKASSNEQRSVDGFVMGDTSMFENGGLSNFRGNVGDFSGSTTAGSDEQGSRSIAASAKQRKPIERQSSKFDFSGFENIQGLKAPINIPSKEPSVRGKFDDLFSQMGWSGVPKK